MFYGEMAMQGRKKTGYSGDGGGDSVMVMPGEC